MPQFVNIFLIRRVGLLLLRCLMALFGRLLCLMLENGFQDLDVKNQSSSRTRMACSTSRAKEKTHHILMHLGSSVYGHLQRVLLHFPELSFPYINILAMSLTVRHKQDDTSSNNLGGLHLRSIANIVRRIQVKHARTSPRWRDTVETNIAGMFIQKRHQPSHESDEAILRCVVVCVSKAEQDCSTCCENNRTFGR